MTWTASEKICVQGGKMVKESEIKFIMEEEKSSKTKQVDLFRQNTFKEKLYLKSVATERLS